MARILIVDDSEMIIEFVRETLEADGHKVFTAKNGLEANKVIFSKQKPDLILLDLIMPMLNGDKVLRAFQQSEMSKTIPVVFFSTRSDEELSNLVKKHNNKGYLRKPISPVDLCNAVKKFLE